MCVELERGLTIQIAYRKQTHSFYSVNAIWWLFTTWLILFFFNVSKIRHLFKQFSSLSQPLIWFLKTTSFHAWFQVADMHAVFFLKSLGWTRAWWQSALRRCGLLELLAVILLTLMHRVNDLLRGKPPMWDKPWKEDDETPGDWALKWGWRWRKK